MRNFSRYVPCARRGSGLYVEQGLRCLSSYCRICFFLACPTRQPGELSNKLHAMPSTPSTYWRNRSKRVRGGTTSLAGHEVLCFCYCSRGALLPIPFPSACRRRTISQCVLCGARRQGSLVTLLQATVAKRKTTFNAAQPDFGPQVKARTPLAHEISPCSRASICGASCITRGLLFSRRRIWILTNARKCIRFSFCTCLSARSTRRSLYSSN